MSVLDWRELGAEEIAPLYEEQTGAWSDALGWDLSASWIAVERARAAGVLPGLVCRSANGRIAGWTFFVRQGDVLQIGALSGNGATPVRQLLEAILDSPEASGARELSCLLYPARPNAVSALSRRRFTLQPLRYLSRTVDLAAAADLCDALPGDLIVRRWDERDAVPGVRLLARAYAGDESARALAPHGTLDEWAEYLGQILRTPACGTLQPQASFVVESRSSTSVVGFILITRIGPSTSHIAQVAVDPAWRGRGVGRTLVRRALKASGAGGSDRLTLLVPGGNDGAARLCVREGFEEAGQLIFAHRQMPVRRQVASRAAQSQRTSSATEPVAIDDSTRSLNSPL